MAPKSNNSQEIAAAVALALAKSTSDTATEVARTAAAAAQEVAKTAAATALVVSSVSQDVTYIKSMMSILDKKFENLSNIFVQKEEHATLKEGLKAEQLELKDANAKLAAKLAFLEQKFWMASGGLAVLVFVLKFLIH